MPAIDFQQLKQHLQTPDKLLPLWLIHGEEFLRAKALEMVLTTLLPNPKDRINYEPVGNLDNQVAVALEKVNTYSFLSGTKIVAMLECRAFDSPKTTMALIDKAKKAVDDDDLKKAAQYLNRHLSVLDLSVDDISGPDVNGDIRRKRLKLGAGEDDEWINTIIDYWRDHDLNVSQSGAPASLLETAITQGFPDNHILIITTDIIDRRRKLFKIIEANGLVVDCVVPKGSRKAEKTIQTKVLKERMGAILEKHNKKLAPGVFQRLYEKTGFQLRLFCSNLEKLVDFVGDRQLIDQNDVESVLDRSRLDPIFELTGAVSERDLDKALFYLHAMQSQSLHPLQINAALINQVRKLIVAREFIDSPHGRIWRRGLAFPVFKKEVLPAIKAYDEELTALWKTWQNALGDSDVLENGNTQPKGANKKKIPPPFEGLYLAGRKVNPYAVFKMLENAHRFELNELVSFLAVQYHLDRRLKSGARDTALELSRLVIQMCIGLRQQAA